MEQTKQCPFCGEEILSVAKKCKHCGEWLNVPTQQPSESSTTASSSPVAPKVSETPPRAAAPQASTPQPSQQPSVQPPLYAEVRKGVTQANYNEDLSGMFFTQIALIAIGIGLYKESWWWFLSSFFGLLFLIFLPYIGKVVCVILSLGWGLIGYVLGASFFTENAGYVIGIFAFLAGLAVNFSGREYTDDLS